MSSISELISQVADLSISDKLSLIDSVVASIRKEGGMPAKKTKAKGEKAEKVEKADKPKRKAALGTLAWTAYVKHCKTTMPDSFEGLSKESEKLVVVKGIRAEDPEGYTTFTEAWKAEHAETASVSDASSVAETESVAEEPKVVKKAAPKPKAAEPKAAEPKAEPKVAKAVKVAPAKAAAEPKAAEPKAAEPKAAEPKAAPKAVKPVKKAAAKAEEVPPMPQKEIDGVSYWHDPESNGLWEVTGPTVADGTGSWIGYFEPGNEEEPIRFTEAFGSD